MNTKGNLELVIQQIENGFIVTNQCVFPRETRFFTDELDAKEWAKEIVKGW